MENMAKIDMFGILALLGSVVAAVLLGGFIYAICRGDPVLDIVALLVVFIIFAGLLYVFFIRSDKGKSEDVVWMTLGGSIGLILYPIAYVLSIGSGDLATAEIAASIILIMLGVGGIILLLKVRNNIRQ